MKLLAIDTTTEACSAALWIDGEVTARFELAPREHGQLILGMVEALLIDAGLRPTELDALGVTRGPGGFTGVRIGIGVAQGIAFAAQLPVVPVSTLAALAQGAWRETGARRVLTAIDARMQEVYVGAFELDADNIMRAVMVEQVCPAQAVPLPPGKEWLGVGTGFERYAEALDERLGAHVIETRVALPHARDVATLAATGLRAGEAVAAEAARPVYLRDDVAKKKAAQATPNRENGNG